MFKDINDRARQLTREEHARIEKHDRLHGQGSKERRQQILEAATIKYGLSMDELTNLLSQPDEWREFTKSWEDEHSDQHGEVVINEQRDPINPKNRTQVTSKSGIVFNTSRWDPAFNPKNRGEKRRR